MVWGRGLGFSALLDEDSGKAINSGFKTFQQRSNWSLDKIVVDHSNLQVGSTSNIYYMNPLPAFLNGKKGWFLVTTYQIRGVPKNT